MTGKLTCSALDELMRYTLFANDEYDGKNVPEDAIIVDGIVNKYGFHPGRIEEKRETIRELLAETPDAFHKGKGGGWSFLQLCVDRHGTQWGEHQNMEVLVALAIASKQGGYCLSREYWQSLPGGVPYVYFDVEEPDGEGTGAK